MKSDYKNFNKEEFQKLINESTSISEILRKLNLKDRGANHTKLSRFLKESDFDTSSLVGRHIKRYNDKGVPKKWLSEVLCENSTGNSYKLKERLIEYGVKKNQCENPKCGITEWCGEPITLELHHINGNHYDNRLENLVLLCPNCHSQTSNFRGKNSNNLLNEKLSEIAIEESKTGMENLLKYEEERKEQIKLNKIKYSIIRKTEKKEPKQKEIIYCKICGNPIEGKGKYFCSVKCLTEYQRGQKPYTNEDIIEKSKECTTLEELGRCFGITGAGIKKRMKNINKLEEVKNNLNLNKKDYTIVQFDLNNIFIKEWKNAEDASKELNISKQHIYSCCRGEQKTCGNFIWKFKNN